MLFCALKKTIPTDTFHQCITTSFSVQVRNKKKRGKMRARIFPRFAFFSLHRKLALALSASFPLLHRENRLHRIAHTLTYRGRSANDEDLLKIGMRIQIGINRHRQIRLLR